MDTAEPIFIVGASRSGTTMVRSSLNAHSRVHVAGETHYFDDLRPRLDGAAGGELPPDARRQCQDYFLALSHRPYGHGGDPERGTLRREALEARARALGDGPDAYFEAFCRMAAGAEGKPRWGEKTPRHVFRIPELLARYPDAKVLCMVRDPRAVVASYRSWRNQGGFDLEADPGHAAALDAELERTQDSYHVITASVMWRSTAAAAMQAAQRYGSTRVRLQRYEDLVAVPEETLRQIAGWLDLPFEAGMLDVPVHNSSFARFDAAGGVRADAVDRWRQTLGVDEVGIVQQVCGGVMRAAGYEPDDVRPSRRALVHAWGTLPAALLRAAAANRHRMAGLPGYVWRRGVLSVQGGRAGRTR